MRHSRMLVKWRVLGTPLRKGWLPSRHIENILKWPKRTFLNMPYSQYPRNRFVMNLLYDKPYIYISSLILYKNLLFPAMYSRLEQAPSSDQIVPPISVIQVRRGSRSLYWLFHCKPVCLLIDWCVDCPIALYPRGIVNLEDYIPILYNLLNLFSRTSTSACKLTFYPKTNSLIYFEISGFPHHL